MRYSHEIATDEEETPSTDGFRSVNTEEGATPSTGQSQLKTDEEGELLSLLYSDKLKPAIGEPSRLPCNLSVEVGEPRFKKMKTEAGVSPSPYAVFQGK